MNIEPISIELTCRNMFGSVPCAPGIKRDVTEEHPRFECYFRNKSGLCYFQNVNDVIFCSFNNFFFDSGSLLLLFSYFYKRIDLFYLTENYAKVLCLLKSKWRIQNETL